jgi:2-polyprenyl-3-methyl-5-hydroxy-6-metoxy-1,4-benzoquinol methylase
MGNPFKMDNSENKYQYKFSEMHREEMYSRKGRERKAKTMVSVLQDYFNTDLKSLTLLDVGSSTGLIANYLAMYFGEVVGIDIDGPAVEFAKATHKKDNLVFIQADSLKIDMPENYFDAVICAQVYEHVPDAAIMMDEIYRVLKPGGVCYFAAGNRLNIIESHYHLPFLSVIPRPLAHIYIRWAGRGKFYYEKHLSYWGLRRLVRKFEVIDYTRTIIENPPRFSIDYMLKTGAMKTRLAGWIVKYAFCLCPGYIWLLKKS